MQGRAARLSCGARKAALLDSGAASPIRQPFVPTSPSTRQKPSLEPATVFRRFAAFCYDLLLLAALLMCFTFLVLALRGGRAVAPGSLWFELALLAVSMAFFCGFWLRGGQTLGMRAWRIRVVTADGGPLERLQAALRFGAAIVALLPAGLGLWWAAFDPERRGWHDRWARTRVVLVSAPEPPPRS